MRECVMKLEKIERTVMHYEPKTKGKGAGGSIRRPSNYSNCFGTQHLSCPYGNRYNRHVPCWGSYADYRDGVLPARRGDVDDSTWRGYRYGAFKKQTHHRCGAHHICYGSDYHHRRAGFAGAGGSGGGYSQQHTYLDGGHRRGGLPCGGGTADFL